ncbi:MAG TPA: CCA tRNA nucleotidyltransferase [Bacillota bacterium]|jgi:tRNA nucleotidyltransferase (CCA-adding enzyme)|nr:CCA tRNA nucleotidyltransferase [Bacillota bacterium]HQC81948.1 CCA tRNA nucleotidyltransferase [Bacillota bacterium]
MMRLPKEITEIMRIIEEDGHQVYIVGGSIRDLLLGIQPEDWDLASNAPPERVEELFGNGGSGTPIDDKSGSGAGVAREDGSKDSAGRKFGVVKVKRGDLTAEVAAFRIDGNYSDHRRPDEVIFTDNIEEDLARRDFTINGIAYHPQKGIIDPFNGRKDLKDRLIRTIGDPEKRFNEDPLRILRGIRLAGQLDFDLTIDTLNAMQKTACLLEQISMDRRRTEFERILITKNTGKALRMCVSANVLNAIFNDCYPPKGRTDQGDFSMLIQNIDRSRCNVDLRLALLLLCFEKKKAMKAIDELNLSKERARMQRAAQNLMMDLHFAVDKYSLKRFIYLNGQDVYDFLNSLSKQQREVYETPGFRIESRYYILDEINKNREPIYVEDLAIDGNDLIEAGIVEGEKVGEMLKMLVDVVHRFPGLNTKPKLLKKAKALKNPIRAKFRNFYFVK